MYFMHKLYTVHRIMFKLYMVKDFYFYKKPFTLFWVMILLHSKLLHKVGFFPDAPEQILLWLCPDSWKMVPGMHCGYVEASSSYCIC